MTFYEQLTANVTTPIREGQYDWVVWTLLALLVALLAFLIQQFRYERGKEVGFRNGWNAAMTKVYEEQLRFYQNHYRATMEKEERHARQAEEDRSRAR